MSINDSNSLPALVAAVLIEHEMITIFLSHTILDNYVARVKYRQNMLNLSQVSFLYSTNHNTHINVQCTLKYLGIIFAQKLFDNGQFRGTSGMVYVTV